MNVNTYAGTMPDVEAQGAPPVQASDIVMQSVSLRVNGTIHQLEVDTRATLLDTLREQLSLFGTKKGCDHGQCGACTVHVNGRRVNSCLTLAVMHDGGPARAFARGRRYAWPRRRCAIRLRLRAPRAWT